MRRPGAPPDEGGQVVTAVVVMTAGILLAMLFAAVFPLGQATAESSQASNAADSAALGAATAVRRDLLDRLRFLRFEDLDLFGRTGPCSVGRMGAEEFAAKNAAVVRSYCYRPADGRVEVEVQLRGTGGEGQPARGRAAASPGFNLASCTRRDDPLPTTTTTTPAPTTAPPGPTTTTTTTPLPPAYPPGTELRCGSVVLRFTIASDGRVQLVPPGRLAALLTPRLVG